MLDEASELFLIVSFYFFSLVMLRGKRWSLIMRCLHLRRDLWHFWILIGYACCVCLSCIWFCAVISLIVLSIRLRLICHIMLLLLSIAFSSKSRFLILIIFLSFLFFLRFAAVLVANGRSHWTGVPESSACSCQVGLVVFFHDLFPRFQRILMGFLSESLQVSPAESFHETWLFLLLLLLFLTSQTEHD